MKDVENLHVKLTKLYTEIENDGFTLSIDNNT